MGLRLGRLEGEIACMFQVQASMTRIFLKGVNYLYLWCYVENTMPDVFKTSYPNTFLIVDATELWCERPSSPSLQSQHYSCYKSHTTLKGLVGIAPNGHVAFVSQLLTASISDRQLVSKSGLPCLLDHVPPGKSIIADRGFEICNLLVKPNLVLNMPPLKGSWTSMPVANVENTKLSISVAQEGIENPFFLQTVTLVLVFHTAS